jgi:hypothetical protein
MRIVDRLLGRRRPHPEVHEEAERERLEGRVDDWREDVYVAGGDGGVAPALPETTPEGLYEDFEHDSERPPDPAP